MDLFWPQDTNIGPIGGLGLVQVWTQDFLRGGGGDSGSGPDPPPALKALDLGIDHV